MDGPTINFQPITSPLRSIMENKNFQSLVNEAIQREQKLRQALELLKSQHATDMLQLKQSLRGLQEKVEQVQRENDQVKALSCQIFKSQQRHDLIPSKAFKTQRTKFALQSDKFLRFSLTFRTLTFRNQHPHDVPPRIFIDLLLGRERWRSGALLYNNASEPSHFETIVDQGYCLQLVDEQQNDSPSLFYQLKGIQPQSELYYHFLKWGRPEVLLFGQCRSPLAAGRLDLQQILHPGEDRWVSVVQLYCLFNQTLKAQLQVQIQSRVGTLIKDSRQKQIILVNQPIQLAKKVPSVEELRKFQRIQKIKLKDNSFDPPPQLQAFSKFKDLNKKQNIRKAVSSNPPDRLALSLFRPVFYALQVRNREERTIRVRVMVLGGEECSLVEDEVLIQRLQGSRLKSAQNLIEMKPLETLKLFIKFSVSKMFKGTRQYSVFVLHDTNQLLACRINAFCTPPFIDLHLTLALPQESYYQSKLPLEIDERGCHLNFDNERVQAKSESDLLQLRVRGRQGQNRVAILKEGKEQLSRLIAIQVWTYSLISVKSSFAHTIAKTIFVPFPILQTDMFLTSNPQVLKVVSRSKQKGPMCFINISLQFSRKKQFRVVLQCQRQNQCIHRWLFQLQVEGHQPIAKLQCTVQVGRQKIIYYNFNNKRNFSGRIRMTSSHPWLFRVEPCQFQVRGQTRQQLQIIVLSRSSRVRSECWTKIEEVSSGRLQLLEVLIQII